MEKCELGYYFARENGSENITIVTCEDNKIIKGSNKDVEILEQVPQKVISNCINGVNILNLREIINQR